MLENWEYDILMKYEDSCIQNEEDREFLEQMSSVGLVYLGFSIDTNVKTDFVETAGLTKYGRNIVKWEYVRRSPFWRFCYILADVLRG